MKLKQRVYLLSGGMYGKLGNVYLVKHSEGYVMIDCGRYDALEVLCDTLSYWGIQEREITHVLLTHGHDDHAGSSSYFQQQGARICVGSGDEEMMIRGNFGEDSPYRNHSMPSCTPDKIFEQDETLVIGDIQIQAIRVPGHTRGSVVYRILADEEELLFSGDMFFADGETGEEAYTGWKGDLAYDGKLLGESFAKLWQMDTHPTLVGGGHGTPILGKPAENILMLAYKYYLLNNR